MRRQLLLPLVSLAGCSGATDAASTDRDLGSSGISNTDTAAVASGSGAETSTTSPEREADGSTGSDESTDAGSTGYPDPAESTGSSEASTGADPIDCAGIVEPPNGLVGWLAADVGVVRSAADGVERWSDRVAPARTVSATGGTPTWIADAVNGRPAVRFDGEDDELSWRDFAVNGSSELTVALVNSADFEPQPVEWCCHTGESGCSGTYDIVFSIDGTGDWGGVIVSPLPEEVAVRFGNGRKVYSDGFYENEAWGPDGYGTCRPDPARDPKVAWRRPSNIGRSWTYTVAVKHPEIIDLYVEGRWVWSLEMPEGVTDIQNTGAVAKLGGGGYSSIPSRRFGGDVAEILIYDVALGDDERRMLERYLACKYFPS